jgi:hypothetical protein
MKDFPRCLLSHTRTECSTFKYKQTATQRLRLVTVFTETILCYAPLLHSSTLVTKRTPDLRFAPFGKLTMRKIPTKFSKLQQRKLMPIQHVEIIVA